MEGSGDPKRGRFDMWTEQQVIDMLFMGGREVLLTIDVMDLIFIYQAYPGVRERFDRDDTWSYIYLERVVKVLERDEGISPPRVGRDNRKNCIAWHLAYQQYLYNQTSKYEGITGVFTKNQEIVMVMPYYSNGGNNRLVLRSSSTAGSDVLDHVLGGCRALKTGTGEVRTQQMDAHTVFSFGAPFMLTEEVAQTYYTLMDRGWFIKIRRGEHFKNTRLIRETIKG